MIYSLQGGRENFGLHLGYDRKRSLERQESVSVQSAVGRPAGGALVLNLTKHDKGTTGSFPTTKVLRGGHSSAGGELKRGREMGGTGGVGPIEKAVSRGLGSMAR